MSSIKLPDGRWSHTMRQSWLKTADLCAERGRRDLLGLTPPLEADAACIGTAIHTAIEDALTRRLGGIATTLDWCVNTYEGTMTEQVKLPAFQWIKYNRATALAFAETCLSHWHEEVYGDLPHEGFELEKEFKVPLYEDENRVILLSGTMDYIDPHGPIDWKTSGRGPFPTWEYERWAIQPTVYTYAAKELGLVEPAEVIPFEYVVMHKKGVQRFVIHRGQEDWDWLTQKCLGWAILIEAELPSWPTNDDHALCSEVWCPNWDTCKGQYVSNLVK